MLQVNEEIKLLEKRIEEKRNEMICIASEKGYTSQEAVRISQELDRLLNEYLTLKKR